LAEDFMKRGQQEPIQVTGGNTGELKVISGHHRLEAAKLAGLPVKYFISEDAKTVDVMHAHRLHKPWTTQNFVNFFDNCGNESYHTFVNLQKKTGLSTGALHVLLFGRMTSKRYNTLLDGTLEIDGKTFLTFKKRWETIKSLIEVRDGVFARKIKAVKFIQVLLTLIEHEAYDHKHFVRRLNAIAEHKLTTVNSFRDGALMLAEVYNAHLNPTRRIDVLRKFEYRNEKEAV
jgi:hypothetical protein